MSDIDDLADALKAWALGPDWKRTATANPLTASGSRVDPDHWFPVPDAVRRRAGHPTITVYNNREWVAAVIVTPTGKNPTVLVPKGVRVIEVQE